MKKVNLILSIVMVFSLNLYAKSKDDSSSILHCKTNSNSQSIVIHFEQDKMKIKSAKYNGQHNLKCTLASEAIFDSQWNFLKLPEFDCTWSREKYGMSDLNFKVGGAYSRIEKREIENQVYSVFHMQSDSLDGVNDSGVVCKLD